MKHGWTRYGDWYGASYGEWCAMFVSFCLNYAQIPESIVPHGAATTAWMNAMKSAGLFRLRSSGYKPGKGDIVFISTASNGIVDHVGIVERVGDDVIETIEGNTPDSVQRRLRDMNSNAVVGYASMEQAMRVADKLGAPAADEKPEAETPATQTDLPETEDTPATQTDLPETPATQTDLPDIDPEMEVVLADAATGVLATFAIKALPEGVELDQVALRVLPVEQEKLAALQELVTEDDAPAKAIAYDISLINTVTGEKFQPLYPVSVSMPVPAGFEGELNLYHVTDEAAAEPEQLNIEEADQACVFETSSFSVFMLMARGAEPAFKTMTLTLLPKGPNGTPEETAAIKEEWKKKNVQSAYEVMRTKDAALTPETESGWSYLSGYDKYAVKGNDWKITWDNLPAKDSDGREWFYCVRTWLPGAVPAPFVSNTGRRKLVTNGSWPDYVEEWSQPDKVDITATINWADTGNQLKKRPETLTRVQLSYGNPDDLRNGEVTKNSNGTYSVLWHDVPTSYNGERVTKPTFTMPELPVHYKTAVSAGSPWTDYRLTNRLNAEVVYVSLNFEPGSLDDRCFRVNGIEMPQKITATLCIDGQPVEREGAAVEYTPTKSGNTSKWANDGGYMMLLLQDDDGAPTPLPEGKRSIRWSSEFTNDPRFTIKDTNYNTVETSIRQIGFHVFRNNNNGNMVYDDQDDALKLRPEELWLVPTRNGEVIEAEPPVRMSTRYRYFYTGWSYWAQTDEAGDALTYGVTAKDLPAYYDLNGVSTVVNTSTFTKDLKWDVKLSLKEPQTAKATVLWEGDGVGSETELQNRPVGVALGLMYTDDDGATWKPFWGKKQYTVAPNPENPNEWVYEWAQLPSVTADGKAVKYKVVQENKLFIYTTAADEPVYTTGEDGKVTHSEFKIHNSYNDNWTYNVSLEWNVPDPSEKRHIDRTTTDHNTQKVIYKLSISAQKSYPVGALEVRVPRELFDNRYPDRSYGTVVNRVSLGDHTNPSPKYNFTYRIDDKGTRDTSDDEMVFYNYKPLTNSDNITLTVEYEISPSRVVDCSVGRLAAKASGQYEGQPEPETQTTDEITYRLDTGLSQSGSASKSHWKNMYYWDSRLGAQPEDFDMTRYNYVVYQVQTYSWNSNQIFNIFFKDMPQDGGEVIRVQKGYASQPDGGTRYTVPFTVDPVTKAAEWKNSDYATGDSYSYYDSLYYYVVVRYPRQQYPDPEHEGQFTYTTDYHNRAEIKGVAADVHEGDKEEGDKNDLISRTVSSTAHWEDYVFKYTGEIYSGSKSLGSFPSDDAITEMGYGADQRTRSGFYMTVNGYNYTDGYRMELTDDGVYVQAYNDETKEQTPYRRLTEQDFEFVGRPTIEVRSKGMDRLTGVETPGYVSKKPFTLWGSTSATGESWQQLGQFTMNADSGSYNPTVDLKGKGIVRLKVTSPDDLKDRFYIGVYNFYTEVKHDSPKLKDWIEDKKYSYITLWNIASMNYYLPAEGGGMTWANPWSSSSDYVARDTGLDALDKARLGSYQYRRKDCSYMKRDRIRFSSYMRKTESSRVYDLANEVVNVRFSLDARESVYSGKFPDELAKEKCHNEGVFYDLLPLGYSFDNSKGVTASGVNGSDQAAVNGIRTIDDYKGTGRQMVMINVKSLRPDGKNWYSGNPYHTGFSVSFWAKAGYNDLKSGETRYNVAAYQRKDHQPIGESYTEIGAPDSTFVYPKLEDGSYAMYDVNGDGVVSEEKNTLYAYDSVTPSFLLTIENGLSKRVRGNSGYFQLQDITDLNQNYTYKLRLTTQKSGETSNVVIYDIFENAANTGGATGETAWKGTFVKADARQARAQGIRAIIWYSTQTGLSYNNENGLLIEKNPGAWSKTPPADLSKVTAIAYDLRLAENGKPFKFAADATIEFEVTMKAPDSLQPSEFAYNRPAYHSTFRPLIATDAITTFNIGGRTKLALHDLQDVEFIKQYEDNGVMKPLAGVEFKLYRSKTDSLTEEPQGMPGDSSSGWNSKPVYTTQSEATGKVAFTNLDSGIYAFVETSTRSGFVRPNNRYWVVVVDAFKGTVTKPAARTANNSDPAIEMTEKEGKFYLKNERYLKDIDIYKSWQDNANGPVTRPTELTFDLYRNDVKIDTKTVQLTQTGSGYTLNKVFTGLYIYDELGNQYSYKVKEHDVPYYTIRNTDATLDLGTGNTKGTFTNRRLGVVDVRKVLRNSNATTAFDFTMTLRKDGAALTEPTTFHARRFTIDQNTYTEEELTLGAGGKLTFKLKGGETLRIIDLPLDVRWAVEEAATQYTVETSNINGTTSYSQTPVAQFTNTPQPTTLTLPVTKAISGHTPPTDKTFQFVLSAVTAGAPMPSPATVAATGAQTVNFAAINYTQVGTYEYTLKENQDTIPGYTFDAAEYAVTVTVTDDNGKLKAVWTAKKGGTDATSLLFTNTYTPTPTDFVLPVKKNITGDPQPSDKQFRFALTAVDGAPMPAGSATLTVTGAGQASFGKISFTTAGEYTYKLKETAGTDTGYTYDPAEHTVVVTVTDDNSTLKTSYKVDGTASTDGVTITNQYKPTATTLEIPVKKTITGNDTPADKTFTFMLEAAGGAPVPASLTTAVTGAAAGKFGAISFTTAGEYTYTIRETNSGEPGYSYDTAAHTVTVTVTDTNGVLGATFKVDGASATHVNFTNQYKPQAATLSLPAKKAITGQTPPEAKTFTFQLRTTDSAPMPNPATITVTGATAGQFAAISFTKAGKFHYEMTEDSAAQEPGYIYDTKKYVIEVTVTDTNGVLSAAWTATRDGEEATELVFTNEYEPASTTLQIPVKKIIQGNATPTNKTFTFTIEAASSGAPMPNADTVTVTGAGTARFGAIRFTKAGTYTYTVKETDGGEPGYTYDSAEHTVTVTVTDTNGQLTPAWVVNGASADAVSFTNRYTPTPVKLQLPVQKALTGNNTPADKQFTFAIAAVDSAPMPAVATAMVTGAGSGTFGEINFTAAGEYRYTVTETDTHEPGYTYDGASHTYVVSVTDTNGVLSATWQVDGQVKPDGAVFTNTYTPAPVTLQISVRKVLTGNPAPADKNFTFKITAVTPNAPMPAANMLSITGANTASFREIKFVKAGEYTYKIQETQGSDHGYTYDTQVHTVVATVTDTNGTLQVTYTVDGTTEQQAVFTNNYKPDATSVTLPVKKNITGNPRPESEKQDFVFTLAAATAGAPMPADATVTINDAGEASFGAIAYDKAGVYKYTLTETGGSAHGYRYDTAARSITVTVTDTNGRLSAVWTSNDATVSKIEFTNTYMPDPTAVTLPVKKTITGKPRPADQLQEFTFTLRAVTSGAPMPDNPVVKITDEGSASFGAISYIKAGVYTYTVTESDGGVNGYGYDAAPRRVTITVTDTNGVLSAVWTVNDEQKPEIGFTNTYNPSAVKVTLPVKKNIEGNSRPAAEKKTFTFKLTAATPGAPMPATDQVTVTDAGQASFSAISYDAAGDYTYSLTELDGGEHGYTYDTVARTVKVSIKDQGGKLVATWTVNDAEQSPVVFTNRYTPDPVTLTVPVKKNINGNPRPAGQEADFTFTMTAVTQGAPMPNPATLTINDAGEANFNPITFTAAGKYNYTLTETNSGVSGYTYDTAVRNLSAVVTDTAGVLSVTWSLNGMTKDKVEFTNTYTPAPALMTLPVRKVMTGNPRPESAKQNFSFTLTAVTADAPMPSPATVTVRDEGTVDFSSIRYTKAGTYTYKLKETEGSAAGYQYDADERTVTVTVTDTNGVLSAAWVVTGKTDPEVTFTNHYEPAKAEVVIPVRKKITGHSRPDGETKTFTFTLAAVTPGAPMPDNATVTVTDEGTASFGAISFAEAKVYEYTLTETDGGAGGYQYDTAARAIKVTVTDNGGALEAVWTSNNASVTEVLFTNDYTPHPAVLQLPVEKHIEYITPPTEKVFTFTLKAKDGAPMPANAVDGVSRLQITGAHTGLFEGITFDKAGVYTYTVQEENGQEVGYTYDVTPRTVTVTVTDHNGQLSAAWKVGDASPASIIFTNHYLPKATALKLPVSKSFTGQPRPSEKEFIFEISAVTPGAPMPDSVTASVTGVGSAQFDAIRYTEVGTWKYEVKERDTHEPGYTYASTVYTATVTVTDENGKLKAAWTHDQAGAADSMGFVNNYKPAPVSVKLPVQKKLTGNPTPSDKTFTFTLSAVTAGAPMPVSNQVTVTGEGTAELGDIEFTAAGVYVYNIKEENGGETGYTYDPRTAKITVRVTDTNGALVASCQTDNLPVGDAPAPAVFTNKYAPVPTKVTVPVTKIITGDATPDNKHFTFKMTAENGAPTPTGNGATAVAVGAATVQFGQITFTAAGDYSYLIEEIDGHAPGYAYDQAKHRVAVHVVDNNGTLSATWTSDGLTVGSVEFTNVYTPEKAKISLPVSKQVPGDPTPSHKNFVFVLTAVNGAPMPDDAVAGESTLTIAGAGESAFGIITYEHAGIYQYKIKEQNGGATGYTYDTTEYDVTVTVEDNHSVLKATWSSPQGTAIEFKNPYAPIPVDLVIPVRKTVEQISPVPAHQNFVFEMEAVTAGAPMPASGSVTINGDGTASFDAIHYLHAGTYEYKLTERNDHAPGYKYDTEERRIQVVVTDNDGTLEVAWTINGESLAEAAFINKYEAKPVELPLMAKKIMKGRRMKANMFLFVLKDDAGNVLQTVGHQKNGDIIFEPLRYSAPGVHTYSVSEVKGSRFGTTYDTTVHTFTVTVTDVGGELKAEMDIPMSDLKWTNSFKARVPYTGDGANTHPWLYAMGAMAMLTLILAIMGQKRRRSSK